MKIPAMLRAVPLWVKVTVPAVLITLTLCQLVGRPTNGPNPAADTLATTRQAFAESAARLHTANDSLKAVALVARTATALAVGKQQRAETRLGRLLDSLGAQQAAVVAADAGVDSGAMLRTRDVVIAGQQVALAVAADVIAASKEAFARLTEQDSADVARADVAETGWRLTEARLGMAERALAVETRRVGCSINLVFTHIKCPSRGVMLVVGLAGGVVADRLLQKRGAP